MREGVVNDVVWFGVVWGGEFMMTSSCLMS